MTFNEWLVERIQKDLPGFSAQVKMTRHLHRPPISAAPDNVKLSGVLLLLHSQKKSPHLLFIKRTEDNGPHSGQMAFPGGKKEKDDASLMHTAFREAKEEININPTSVQLLGELTPLYVPVSNFLIHPFIAWDQENDYWENSPYEVQSIHSYPLDLIFKSKKETSIYLPIYRQSIKTIAYVMPDENIIWGATAMILAELEELYNEFLTL